MASRYYFLILLFYISTCYSAHILIVDNLPSPSHQIWNMAIAEGLLERGHHVTMLAPITIKPLNHTNFTYLGVHGILEVLADKKYEHVLYLEALLLFGKSCVQFCEVTYKSQKFKELLNHANFDAILLDISTDACFLPLIEKFGYPPTIASTPIPISPIFGSYFGNDLQPAFIPSFVTEFSDEMNLYERCWNYFYHYFDMFARKYILDTQIRRLATQTFGNNIKPFEELRKYMSIFLTNSDPTLFYPQPTAPNIIPVAGAHIRKLKPLEKNIKKIMDESKNGVILFSLGTNIQSKNFTLETRRAILTTFGQLNQTILWKFESNITDLPKNVIVRKWLQQTEILAHPNTKLFISHAGGLSVIETAHFGVPMLGIPFFGDQHINIASLVKKGVARKVDFEMLSTEKFLDNIKKMLNNKKYAMNMKQLSKLFKDQPQFPMERALFWIEYVIRNNGTNFDTKSRHLPLFITASLDVKLVIVIIIFGICALVYKFMKLCRKRRSRNDLKVKKN